MKLSDAMDPINYWGTLILNDYQTPDIKEDQYNDLLTRIRVFKRPKNVIEQSPFLEQLQTIEEATSIIQQEPKEVRIKRNGNKQHYQDFMRKLENYALQTNLDHDTMLKLEFLAGLESRYEQGVENYQGSTALGWFQFMDETRHDYNKQSRKDFANDANAQFQAAVDHINFIDRAYISKWKKEIKDAGLNDFQALYGFWWNPSDMEKFLKDNNYNRVTKYNESIQKILKRAGYEKSNSNSRG